MADRLVEGDVEKRVRYGTAETHDLGEECEPRRYISVYDQHRLRSVHEPSNSYHLGHRFCFQFQARADKYGNR